MLSTLKYSAQRLLVRMLHVFPIPAASDNYMYLLVDSTTKEAAAVDPLEPDKIIAAAKEHNVKLGRVLTTHHHWDHAGGNQKLCDMVPNLTVYGGDERVEALNSKVTHGDKLKVGELDVDCIFTPCHTSGHICYYVTDKEGNKVVFTGDTMFIAGCGRFFEGTADQMYDALVKKLGSLPDDTKVYCGHEYTLKNLRYAQTAEPSNEEVTKKLDWANIARKNSEFTVPSTIGEEKLINPFMRVHELSVQRRANSQDPVEVMQFLRSEKDRF